MIQIMVGPRTKQKFPPERVAISIVFAAFSVFAILFSIILPTEHSWDPGMPEYSDDDMVFLVTLAAAVAFVLALLGAAIGFAHGIVMRLLFAALLVICVHRLYVLLPHFLE
ncbi:hypothetical protein [Nonomuraea endophytica]|uniref:hypothetical protein n=1 Tax=Nonomuraea endophytica TaxID=714136 RepID=UPI0037C55C22